MKNTKKLLVTSEQALLTNRAIKILDENEEKVQISIGTIFVKRYIFDFKNKKIEFKGKSYTFENNLNFEQDEDFAYIILNNKKFKLFMLDKKCVDTINAMCDILQELAKGNFGKTESETMTTYRFNKPLLYLDAQLNFSDTIVLLPEENSFKFDFGFMKRQYAIFNLSNKTFNYKDKEYSFDDIESVKLNIDGEFEVEILFEINGLKKALKYTTFLEKGKEVEYTEYTKKIFDAFNQVIKGNDIKVDNKKDSDVYIDETLSDDKKQALSFILPLTKGVLTNLQYITNTDLRKLFFKASVAELNTDKRGIEAYQKKIENLFLEDGFFNDIESKQTEEYRLYSIILLMRIEKAMLIGQKNSEDLFWERMMVCTKYIKDNNSSYEEFAKNFLKGREDYFKDKLADNEVSQEYMDTTFKLEQEESEKFIQNLLTNPNSVWNTVKF